jgi:Glycosyl hydrolases family 39
MNRKQMLKSVLLWVSGVLVTSAFILRSSQAAQIANLRPPDVPIPPTLFGMHIHHLDRGVPLTQWPSVPFGTWRVWDAYVPWPSLEPEKGKWDFTRLDKYVAAADQHHVDVLLTLGLTPAWASARPAEKSSYGPGNAAEPKDISDWRDYVQAVATRYKGRIHEYEIWNEPNLGNFYTGSVGEMAELGRVAYQTLKQVDPTITVCSPSATGSGGVKWLDQYLKSGGGEYADVIGFHLYVNPSAPEEMLPLIQQVEQVMRNDGAGDKPLWDTETGWAIQNTLSVVQPASGKGFNSIVLSPDQASTYLARTYILSWASGVSRLYWYAWDNGTMGLVENGGKILKAPARAYGELENWLIGARMTSCSSDSAGTWTCEITRDNGYHGWIVWNPDHPVQFAVPADWGVKTIRDLEGNEKPMSDKTTQITATPVLLERPAR